MTNANKKIITLDLWDTVIRRKCHPDQIKEMTSEYILLNMYEKVRPEYRTVDKLTKKRIECERNIGEETRQKGLDDEYEIHDVFRRLIREAFIEGNTNEENAAKFYEIEIENEIQNAYLDPTIEQEIDSIEHDEVAYVSDFYAGKEYIDQVLDAIGCPIKFDYKFISCESGLNKRSGRLYDYALEQMKVATSDVVHIGDNSYSDVEVPKDKGIQVIHYVPEKEHALRKQKEENYSLSKNNIEKTGKKDLSFFFYGFIRWIADSCISENIKKIYFFTREGEFYKEIYDEIVATDTTTKLYPKAEVLEVSRLATFFPSLRGITTTELMRIWNQYSIQSPAALFKSLGIDKALVLEYVEKYGIEWDKAITYPWQDDRVIALFEDSDFQKVMHEEQSKKRDLIYAYLNKKGLDKNTGEKIAIVDIGWRGTIQDNISYLLPNHFIKGFYVGLLPMLNEQPGNVAKSGYLGGYDHFDYIIRNQAPFEMVCNSPNGSTIGYKNENGDATAIRKNEEAEDRVFYEHIQYIQARIIREIARLSNEYCADVYFSCDMRSNACDMLKAFLLSPPKNVARAFFSLKHNEEFGVGEYIDKSTKLRLDLMVMALFGRKYRSALAQFLRDTTWPQGYLSLYNLRLMLLVYNLRYSNE